MTLLSYGFLGLFQIRLNGFANFKVGIIVEVPGLRLWWRNLRLRWRLLIMGLEEDRQHLLLAIQREIGNRVVVLHQRGMAIRPCGVCSN
jgi:hypothetical protein